MKALVAIAVAALLAGASERRTDCSARIIRLTQVEDVVGAGREWFHAEYVPPAPKCPAPTYSVTPDIWLEVYWRDPYYGWIAGLAGTYNIKARGCDADGGLTITIPAQ